MSQKLIQTVGRSTRLKALNELKRTQGLSVGELSDKLDMSYMGVKDLCLDLQKRGLLEVRREPKPKGITGRPRMLYCLTERARELFPSGANPLTLELLEVAKQLNGPTAAEKLLMLVWQRRTAAYAGKVKGASLKERAKCLVQLREAEGHMAEFTTEDGVEAIVEHHSPLEDVIRTYPFVARLEEELFSKLLGVAVHRTEQQTGGQLRITYTLPLLSH